MVDQIEDIVAWYTEVDDEEQRLTRAPHTRIEAIRTRELIEAHLPTANEPLRILDIGGGAGAYAGWLAGLGHHVHLIDPVPRHVEAAARLRGVTAAQGDARSLPEADEHYDVVLVLGPLYHLSEREDRVRAVREAARVAKPGAPVLMAAIGRYSVIGEYVLEALFDERYQDVLAHLVGTGENSDDLGFPLRHAHTWDELRQEAIDAGLTDLEVFGVEGPWAYAVDKVAPDQSEAAISQAVIAARMLATDRRMIDASPHLLAVGRRPAQARGPR